MKLAGFEHGYAQGSFLWIVNNINFQYFSVLITLVSAVVMVAVSYATSAPDYPRIVGLTFETATDADRALTRSSWEKKDVIFSAFILACILGAYIYFSGLNRPGPSPARPTAQPDVHERTNDIPRSRTLPSCAACLPACRAAGVERLSFGTAGGRRGGPVRPHQCAAAWSQR